MARYGREYTGGYPREFGARNARSGRYGRDFGGGYGRDHGRGYDGGWGMTGLYNTIMHGGPRGGRYGEGSYDPPLRSGRGGYWGGSEGRRGEAYGGRSRTREGFASDRGSIGIHYRPYDRGFR